MRSGVVLVSKLQLRSTLNARVYIDRCVRCGAQKEVSHRKIGIYQHDDTGRCFKMVMVRKYLGSTYQDSAIGGY